MVLDRFGSRSGKVESINIIELVVELKVWNLEEKKSIGLVIDISGIWESKFHEVVDSLIVNYLDFHNIVVIIY